MTLDGAYPITSSSSFSFDPPIKRLNAMRASNPRLERSLFLGPRCFIMVSRQMKNVFPNWKISCSLDFKGAVTFDSVGEVACPLWTESEVQMNRNW